MRRQTEAATGRASCWKALSVQAVADATVVQRARDRRGRQASHNRVSRGRQGAIGLRTCRPLKRPARARRITRIDPAPVRSRVGEDERQRNDDTAASDCRWTRFKQIECSSVVAVHCDGRSVAELSSSADYWLGVMVAGAGDGN